MGKKSKQKRYSFDPYEPTDIHKLKGTDILVTYDDQYTPYGFIITQEIALSVNKYLVRHRENPVEAIPELKRLIQKMPHVPQFRNHLYHALRLLGKNEEALEVNEQALKDIPDYLFAILNKAFLFLENQNFSAIETLLGGPPFSIQRTFPKRELFHIREVLAYYSFLIQYWLVRQDLKAAKSISVMLKKAIPNHPYLEHHEKMIARGKMLVKMGNALKEMKTMQEKSATREPRTKSPKPLKSPPEGDPRQGNLFE